MPCADARVARSVEGHMPGTCDALWRQPRPLPPTQMGLAMIRSITIPIVTESTRSGERSVDIFSRLLKERIIFITGEINDNLSSVVVAQLLLLESEDPSSDIHMYINSPGGYISSGMCIYDTMRHVRPCVSTLCVGRAASMAAFLLAGGTRGKRYALSNSRIMIHQPLGGMQGQASDIEIHAREILTQKEHLNQLLAMNTGQSVSRITTDTDRDYFMSSHEARAYGIVDFVLGG